MKNRWIAAAAAACAVALLVVPMMVKSAGRGEEKLDRPAGDAKTEGPAKLDLTLKDMNGAAVRLADYKGKVIVLNFWATWCGPCQTEIPELVDTYVEFKDKDVVLLGISIDDTAETLQKYAKAKGMNYPVLLMQDDVDEAYGPIIGVPITVFIGRDGVISRRHLGPITKEQVEREIKALL
jgi:peroxiredoxin